MPQVTRCPHCHQSLQLPDGAAGKPIRCPLCKQVFTVRAAPVAQAIPPRPINGSAVAKPPAILQPPAAAPRRSEVARPPAECPSCKARLPRGATACLECGYLLQADGAGVETET